MGLSGNKTYISFKVKFKANDGYYKPGGNVAYFHDIKSKNLIQYFATIENTNNKWISYALVELKRYHVDNIGNEKFYNKENRVFIRKNEKFLEFNGRTN